MHDNLKSLLLMAKHEVIQLRKQNEILSAKVDVIEVFAVALGMRQQQLGMSVDIVWEIEQKIKEMETVEKETPKQVESIKK